MAEVFDLDTAQMPLLHLAGVHPFWAKPHVCAVFSPTVYVFCLILAWFVFLFVSFSFGLRIPVFLLSFANLVVLMSKKTVPAIASDPQLVCFSPENIHGAT